ncbi:30S ribosomal protein S20 [Candidatus Tremblaya princeps]|uniref:Small ribosomal subunit protein bS20 n=1 Tax=Tremblaya princeps TaxID=189385 RepID=A0A143WNK0_TREPR|nr:30S ribosomal protein S20 [Candidatus Tremblaya princeps]
MKRLHRACRLALRNRSLMSRVAAAVKDARLAIRLRCREDVMRALATMARSIDVAHAKGALHRNCAARRKRALFANAANVLRDDAPA